MYETFLNGDEKRHGFGEVFYPAWIINKQGNSKGQKKVIDRWC